MIKLTDWSDRKKERKRMSPKVVNKEEKKTAIAVAAGELFGRHGFDRVKIEDIAKNAGIGKGTVYEYFKTKEDILHSAFETMMSQIMAKTTEAFNPQSDPVDSILAMSQTIIEGMEEVGGQYRFFLEYMLHCSRCGDSFSFLNEILLEFRTGIAMLLEVALANGQIRKDIDIEKVSAAFVAWFDGAVFHWIVLPEPNLKEMSRAFLDTFFNGILIKSKGGKK